MDKLGKYTLIAFFILGLLIAGGSAADQVESTTGQSSRDKQKNEQTLYVLGHEHRRFWEEERDGFSNKLVMTANLTTDILDWKNRMRVRLENPDSIFKYFGEKSWSSYFNRRANSLLESVKTSSGKLEIIAGKNDFDKMIEVQSPVLGIIVGSEGISFLNGDASNLEVHYDKHKLRHLQIYREPIPYPAVSEVGMTDYGKRLVEKANELGIAIDVTHIPRLENKQVLKDVIAYSKDPVILSHNHHQNFGGMLTDDQIKQIAASGDGRGMICIPLLCYFLDPCELSTVVESIIYTINLTSEDNVGVAGEYSTWNMLSWVIQPNEIEKLKAELKSRGLEDSTVNKILGENLVNYYSHIWE